LTGAVIVSTPQDISLIDARRGVNMFKQVNVPVNSFLLIHFKILGLVENMSFFKCPCCGHKEDIFSHGGAKATSLEMEMPFLGEIPIHIDIRTNSDKGTPIALSRNETSEPFYLIAEKVMKSLDETKKKVEDNIPKIIIE
jgi:ATP-binding protein involved in chromosome partitioning